MTDQDTIQHVKVEIKAIKAEEVKLNFRYKHIYQSGMGTFALLDDIERVRKRRVVLEDALRELEEVNKE